MRSNGRLRRDSQHVRDRLVSGAGELIAARGPHFSLPDLARHTGVGTATVYRHFTDVGQVCQAYFDHTLDGLVEQLEAVATAPGTARARLRRLTLTWVEMGEMFGRAASRLRRAEGVLERYHAGDPSLTRLVDLLSRVLDDLIAEGEIPDQGREYAVLIWITLFDERVFIDLLGNTNWSVSQIASSLESSLIGALRNRPT